jgi:hypothetical protein
MDMEIHGSGEHEIAGRIDNRISGTASTRMYNHAVPHENVRHSSPRQESVLQEKRMPGAHDSVCTPANGKKAWRSDGPATNRYSRPSAQYLHNRCGGRPENGNRLQLT